MIQRLIAFLRRSNKPSAPLQSELANVRDILFPRIVLEKSASGSPIWIDRSIDINLSSILIDLESDRNDELVRQTLRRCIDQLGVVKDILVKDPSSLYPKSASDDESVLYAVELPPETIRPDSL